jgi:hypothetical protein
MGLLKKICGTPLTLLLAILAVGLLTSEASTVNANRGESALENNLSAMLVGVAGGVVYDDADTFKEAESGEDEDEGQYERASLEEEIEDLREEMAQVRREMQQAEGQNREALREELNAMRGELRELVDELEEWEEESEEEDEDEPSQWKHQYPPARLSPLNFGGRLNLDGLRKGIAYLHTHFKGEYAGASEYLRRLDALEERFDSLRNSPGTVKAAENKLERDVEELRIDAFVRDNPLLNCDKLVFVKRYTYQSSHFYTDFIDGIENPGGNLCVLDLRDGAVRDIVPELGGGVFGRYDLSFDARRIVFDWKRKIGEGFRIFEVNVDGTGLRQLTFPPADEKQRIKRYDNSWRGDTARNYFHHTDDLQPCYLPDGGICFVSSRCEYDILCDGGILTTTVLYRVDGNGRNMEKLTNSAVSESSPSMLPDGRILYTRWEYVDKSSLTAKGLWAIRPDGTSAVEIFGNDIPLPPCFLHGRAIPGMSNMYVCLGAPHFPQSGVGPVIRLDTSKDIRTREPMTYITPEVDIGGGVFGGEGGWDFWTGRRWAADRRGTSGRLYMDPYPLSESVFIVSCKIDPRKPWNDVRGWGLYILDEFGNHTPIYEDPEFSCWQPMELLARKSPPVLHAARDPDLAGQGLAACVVADVHHGLEDIEQGEIKYIRINEQVPRPWCTAREGEGGAEYAVARGTHMGLKVQHGIVPVEKDGSAYFLVPADKNIFLQVLDENYMEVQRERTYMNLRPGEVRSCVGCHEKPKDAVPVAGTPKLAALRRGPSRPGPQPGETAGARVIHYPVDVQPVWDKHCISCHGSDDPAGDLDLTGALTELFNRSYKNLLDWDLMTNINEDEVMPTYYLPAKSLGSHASRLVSMLRQGHEGVKLSTEEMIRVTTWVDSNAQYYGTYFGRKSIEHKSHPNFRPVPTFDQAVSLLPPLPETSR